MSTLGSSSSILFVASRVLGTVNEAPLDFLNFLENLGRKSFPPLGKDFEFLEWEIVEADLQDG